MTDGPLMFSGPSAILVTGAKAGRVMARLLAAIGLLTGALAISGCGRPLVERPIADSQQQEAPGLAAAAQRAVLITTTACGYSPGIDGSGVALSDRTILTAAHVVAGAESIRVTHRETPQQRSAGGATVEAVVVAYDPLRDLAVLELVLAETLSLPDGAPQFRVGRQGQTGVIVGARTSGDVEYTIAEKTTIEMDEVRGQSRSQRSGYRLDATTLPGDSGSGLYDPDGHLIGILFGVSTEDGQRSWATAADEVEAFLTDTSVAGSFACNPERSRMQATD